jgi:nanoRNase/pAp phosphatase (c-di-AMP/oligoRNAs hydrolase)
MLENINPSTDKKIAIWMHKGPDPDSIGSALGLGWLFKKKWGMEYDIYHTGIISHPENRSLINVLNLSFGTPEEFEEKKEDYQYVAIVDGTEKNVGHQVEADIIIDHHRAQIAEGDYAIALNEQVGACCSLVYKLIKEAGIEMTQEDEVIATSLLFGIITDTNNFLSETVTDLEFEAFAFFRESANLSWVTEIKSYPIPSYFFNYEAVASDEENKFETNGTLISFLGQLSPQRRDVLPYIADRLMRKEATDTTVIMAIIDNHLVVSIRSKKVSLDVNDFAQKIFGEEYAGGKRGSGGASVPMGIFNIPEDDSSLREEVIEVVKNMMIAKIKREIIKDG